MKVAWILVPAFLFSFQIAFSQTADEELRLGIVAYKENHYEQAMQHFEKATELDPANVKAHMYLATTHMSQYIPGVDTEDNLAEADNAIAQYQLVLEINSNMEQRVNSAKGIAYLYLNMKKWDDARKYYQMASDFNPNDPEPYYSIGVIDWTRCYQPRMEGRAQLDMRAEEHLSSKNSKQKKLCDDLRAKNWPVIEDGISNLNRAIELRRGYDDAMAYMNLMYREKADLECADPAARNQDLKTADEWVDKALGAKRAKADKTAMPK